MWFYHPKSRVFWKCWRLLPKMTVCAFQLVAFQALNKALSSTCSDKRIAIERLNAFFLHDTSAPASDIVKAHAHTLAVSPYARSTQFSVFHDLLWRYHRNYLLMLHYTSRVLCGTVWCYVALHDASWGLRGTVWCYMVLRGAALCFVRATRYSMVLHVATWCCMLVVVISSYILCYMVLNCVSRCSIVLHGVVWCYIVLHGAAQCYLVLRTATRFCVMLHVIEWR